MKRFFINQDGVSNKFWNAEISEKVQTITWGKIGTEGRQSVKFFDTVEKCRSETEKQISRKLKKGYIEVFEKTYFSEKVLPADESGELFFWNSIEKSNRHKNSHWSKYDVDEHLENLVKLLSVNDKEKLILFEKCLQENLYKLYTAKIAELSIILKCDFKRVNGQIIFDDYLSDDGFIYFRCWLLLKGKKFFDEISKNITAFVNGKYSSNIGDIWAEGLLYAADRAYAVNHENKDECEIREAVGELYPEIINYDSSEREMTGTLHSGAELQKMYPKLVREITKLRTPA